MSLIHVSNMSFAYDGTYDYIFKNVSFQFDTNWKLGLIGRNGRGKTTFLKLLNGQYNYQGTISSSVDFEYFPYQVEDTDFDTLTILQNISQTKQEWELRKEIYSLAMTEDVLYRSFNTLSFGEQTKALLAALFLKENNFLLIDEPTNHLDMTSRELVSHYLSQKKGYILVSHDRSFLDGCVDHILSINRANIEIQRGTFSSWMVNKTRLDNFEIAENKKLKKEIKRLKETAREKANWSDRIESTKIGHHVSDRGWVGHQAARMMKRSKTIETRQKRVIEEKSKLLKNIESAEELSITQLPYHTNQLLHFRDFSINYGNGLLFQAITFSVNQGDRVVIQGGNGAGKTSLIKLICGNSIPYCGIFECGSQLKISYVPQDTTGLTGSFSNYARKYSIDESLFKAILRKLDFERIQFEKDISNLSSGQKKKLLIARSLCEKAHLHIWDEPLNYIDILSRIQIEELIIHFQPTILFVEHDKSFCEKTATKTIKLLKCE